MRKLSYHTASIELVFERVTSGNNFVGIVSQGQGKGQGQGQGQGPLFNFDRLGGKYSIGQISYIPNDDDAYEIVFYDCKYRKSS